MMTLVCYLLYVSSACSTLNASIFFSLCTRTVYCQKEKRATVFCKVGVPIAAKQNTACIQQLQQLVCVGVWFVYAARATAH
jgi:hypothetical protein